MDENYDYEYPKTDHQDEINKCLAPRESKGEIFCREAYWKDIVLFLVLNYGAHAFTILTPITDSVFEIASRILFALFIPTSGIGAAILCIYGRIHMLMNMNSKFTTRANYDLRRAHYAGALYTLAVVQRLPNTDYVWIVAPWALVNALKEDPFARRNDEVEGAFRITKYKHVPLHGAPKITRDVNKADRDGFFLMPIALPSAWTEPAWGIKLSTDAEMDLALNPAHTVPGSKLPEFKISNDQNYLKVVVAIFQGFFALYGIYEARTCQLTKYGYASFSFTVLPYAMMSLINLLAMLCQPGYQTAFLVKYDCTPKEDGDLYHWHPGTIPGSETHNIQFSPEGMNHQMEGAVGSFQLSPRHEVPRVRPQYKLPAERSHDGLTHVTFITMLFVTIVPYIIIHWLTKFQPQSSTATSRFLIVFWFVVPAVVGLWQSVARGAVEKLLRSQRYEKKKWLLSVHRVFSWSLFGLGFLAGIGGYYTVVTMILDYGVCMVL